MAFFSRSVPAAAPPASNILLVYKNLAANRASGSHVGLGVTAQNAAKLLRTAGHTVEVASVYDGYELRDVLLPARPQTTHVVMCAPWVDTPFLQGLIRRYAHVHFAVVYHSNVGFLQADKYAVRLLREQMELELINHNFSLAVNSARLQAAIQVTFQRPALLLPNLYALGRPAPAPHLYYTGDTLRLGVFGAMRQQKNMLTAVWAGAQIARRMGVRAQISINSGRIEGGDSVLGAIRELLTGMHGVELVESGWMAWTAFRRYVASQHLLLSPSYTESFCNVTADGIAEGVASVVSDAIPWTPAGWRANADDAGDIASVGIGLLRNPSAAANGYWALTMHNALSLQAWNAWLAGSQIK